VQSIDPRVFDHLAWKTIAAYGVAIDEKEIIPAIDKAQHQIRSALPRGVAPRLPDWLQVWFELMCWGASSVAFLTKHMPSDDFLEQYRLALSFAVDRWMASMRPSGLLRFIKKHPQQGSWLIAAQQRIALYTSGAEQKPDISQFWRHLGIALSDEAAYPHFELAVADVGTLLFRLSKWAFDYAWDMNEAREEP